MTFETSCDKCGGINGHHLNCDAGTAYQKTLRNLAEVKKSPSSEDDFSCVSALRIYLYDCRHKSPSDYMRNVAPSNALSKAWIPQTMGEQIWVLYEFDSKNNRLAWESRLPSKIAKWLDRKVIPYAKKYGWQNRDASGFAVGELGESK